MGKENSSAKIKNNQRRLSEESKKRISDSLKVYYKEHPMKVKNSKEKLKKICPICQVVFEVSHSEDFRIYCSRSCFRKDKKFIFCGKAGGYMKGSGRGKKGWYKGFRCDSSWELAFVIYNIDNKIPFKRNELGFEYTFQEEKRKYYPDFIMEDGTYIEIKGFITKKDEIKIKSFKDPIVLIDEAKMKPYLDYVVKTYGENFIEKYENSPYIERKKKCLICGEPAINLYCSRKCSGIASHIRRTKKF